MKIIFGAVAALLAVVGYIPYIKDTVQRKTTPHPYSWFLWTLQTAIVYALQVINGAGAGSWMTLVITIMSVLIFVLSLKNGKAHITLSDTVYLVVTLLALFLWLVVKEPVLSVIIITAIDVLTFVPTVRKSWGKPYSETAFTYELGVFRHGLSIFALQSYNLITWLNPAAMVVTNGLFSLMLFVRKRQIRQFPN